jgi:hypothetical protein
VTKRYSSRALFGDLLPGDVLVHTNWNNDLTIVLRVGERLDLFDLIDGRLLEAWVAADSPIPPPYEVLRGGTVVIHNEGGYKSSV